MFSKPRSTHLQEAQRFTQSLQVTGQPEMLTISLPRQKTEAVRQMRWSLRWKQAIAQANIDASQIGYVNAHGTATNKGDTVETASIKSVFGDKLPYVSSTKGATGHMMGAGGITEVITCVKAIETGVIPPTINLNEVDPECSGIDFVANTAKKAEIDYAMSNAFGFGGQNSSIIVGRYKG